MGRTVCPSTGPHCRRFHPLPLQGPPGGVWRHVGLGEGELLASSGSRPEMRLTPCQAQNSLTPQSERAQVPAAPRANTPCQLFGKALIWVLRLHSWRVRWCNQGDSPVSESPPLSLSLSDIDTWAAFWAPGGQTVTGAKSPGVHRAPAQR